MFFRKKNQTSTGGQNTVAVSSKLDQKLSSDFILNAIDDGVMMIGLDGTIQLFNPGASKITGWPAHESVGLNYQSVIRLTTEKGEPWPKEQEPFNMAITRKQAIHDSRLVLLTRTEKRIPISLTISPVNLAPGGQIDAFIGVFRDITVEKEEERRRTEFISTASHEMRTPIAAIEGYLSLALNPKISQIDARTKQYLDKAHSATQHLGQLFQDLLTSSQAEDDRLASYPAVVELGEVITATVDSAKFTAKKKGLELNFMISTSHDVNGGKVIRPLYFVFVDPNRIREIVQNLIDNSIKYTQQGSITVALTGNDSVAQIQVKDTGAGISAEDIPHLFQKFYRVDNSMTRSVGGTGLGLYITRRLVELYQGRVWVESQLGKGSTFYINLPRLTSEKALQLQRTQSGLIKPEGSGKI